MLIRFSALTIKNSGRIPDPARLKNRLGFAELGNDHEQSRGKAQIRILFRIWY